MSYQVHNFRTGDVIEAPPANEMDAQILQNSLDIGGKANKPSSATNGNLAALDSEGNLTDSGRKASDFGTYSKPDGGIPASDLANGVIPEVHNIPPGGTAGQVLKKVSRTNYDVIWSNESGGGGSAIDDEAGEGDTDKTWSANKLYSIEERIADLEYKPLTLNSLSAAPNIMEIGTTVTNVNLTYAMNKDASQMQLDGAKSVADAT